MKILFVSNDLIAGNVAYLLKKEGHDVKLYIHEEGRRGNLKNLVTKTLDWEKELRWVGKNGLIVFDDTGYGHLQESLRKEGYFVFGGSRAGDSLELNRVFAQEIFEKCNISTLPTFNFKGVGSAISFVKKNPGMWVIKQNGTSSKSLNYVGNLDDGRDVIDVLKSYKNNNYGFETITLQKKVSGVEIAATRYFNGKKWIGPTLINIEHKKFFPGDLGPTTSEMGTLGWYDNNDNNKLFQETLAKIEPYLRDINYRGVFDINCIVNKQGTFPLEATSRFGSPIVHLQTELDISDWSSKLEAVAHGNEYKLSYKKGFGIVVVLAIPPFPYTKKTKGYSQIGTNIYFDKSISKNNMCHIHFEEVSYDKIIKEHYISDNRGYVLYVTGYGRSVQEARKKAYDIIEKIYIPKVFYRNDIGLKFIEKSESELREWGYIK